MQLVYYWNISRWKCFLCNRNLLAMKFLILLLTINCFQVKANTYAQQVTLKGKNIPIKRVFQQIYKQTGYQFVFANDLVSQAKPVTISVKDAPLRDVLESCFAGQPFSYQLTDKFIIVKKKSLPDAPAMVIPPPLPIKGRITDTLGNPLTGVTVRLKNGTSGAVTDAQGSYSIEVPEDAVLVVSYIGYETQEIAVRGRENINISLRLASSGLSQVVVTALGINKEKRAVGYAVSKVSADDLNSTGQSSMLLNLEGKVPGLVIQGSANGFDGTPRVLIRGATSLSADNQPLYILDGMPLQNNQSLSESLFTSSSGNSDYGTPLSDINSNDIESITVLKGVSASALYGSRGANGVVIITTKKGTKRGIGITYTNSSNWQTPVILPSRQTEYGQGMDQQYSYVDGAGNGINEDNTSMFGPKYDGQMISQWDPRTGGAVTRPWLPYGKDNLKNFFITGHDVQHHLSLSKVSDAANIRVSLGYEDMGGIVPNTGLKRITGNLNSNFKLGKKVSVQALFTTSNENSKNRSAYGYGSGAMWDALFIPTNIDIRDLRNYKDSLGNKRSFYENGPNPYWDLYENLSPSVRKRFSSNLGITYDVTSWLSLQGHIYDDYNSTDYKNITAKDTYTQGAYLEGLSNNEETNFEARMLINKNITKDLHLGFMFGGNMRHNKGTDKVAATQGGLLVRGIYNLANSAQDPTVTNTLSEQKVNSLYGSLDLSYKDYIFVSATGRNDWSSTLPRDNWSFFYPALSASFIFTDAFNIQSNFFSYGKLRASWGKVGNATAPYSLNRYITRSGSSYNGQPVLGIQNVIPALKLNPEESKSFEAGGEFNFLKDRVKLDLSYYDNSSGNQLVQVENAWDRGSRYAFINAGIVTNKGIEANLDITPVKTSRLTWNVSVNFSRNRGSVSGFPSDLVTFKYIAAWNGPETHAGNGQPYGEYIGFEYYKDTKQAFANTPSMASDFAAMGLDEKNIYGTGKILTSDGMPMSNQLNWSGTGDLGKSFPYDWTGGIMNTFLYKNFRLSFLFDIRDGGYVVSTTRQTMQLSGMLPESAGVNQRGGLIRDNSAGNGGYLFEGTDVATGKPNSTYVDAQTLFSNWYFPTTAYLNSATNIKLRELSIAYNFPSALVNRIGLSNAVFSLTGRNLWLIKNGLPGIDTETANMGALNNGGGFETGSLPNTRSFGFSLTVGL